MWTCPHLCQSPTHPGGEATGGDEKPPVPPQPTVSFYTPKNALGACLDAYWEQKKRMCDAEPPAVTKMLARLRPLVHGAALAGAGGGGFLFCVTKEPDAADAVRAALDGEGELREVAIDEDGLRC